MAGEPHHRIVKHYEDCLAKHGDGAAAVNWRDDKSAQIRYDVMLDLIREDLLDKRCELTLLDFGCGLGALKDHIDRCGFTGIHYAGLDLSPQFADATRARHRDVSVYCCDVMDQSCDLPDFDYVVMNGIFTCRHNLSLEEMKVYFEKLSTIMFAKCRKGLAFNLMSSCVDWESDSLFHVCHGEISRFICKKLSRHFVLRNDYGLYETTCYVYQSAGTESGRAEL